MDRLLARPPCPPSCRGSGAGSCHPRQSPVPGSAGGCCSPMPGSSPGSGPGSGPGRCGQTPGQRCRSRGCHWATPRICGTIEPAEPFGLALGEQLHVVPSRGAGHHAADGHGDDVQQIVPPALRPPGIRQTAEMFHQAGSLAAAHHHYPSQPEPIPCFVPRFYQHPQFRMRLPWLLRPAYWVPAEPRCWRRWGW